MKLTTAKLIKDMELEVINKEHANINKTINGITSKRSGLELAGFKMSEYYAASIIGWGTKERMFFESLSSEEFDKALENVLFESCPLIILSYKLKDNKIIEKIIEKANKYKIAVVRIKTAIGHFQPKLTTYLLAHNAKVKSVHGSLVVIHGRGVLIKGPSGIGKSEAVLELVHNGHTFISDDTVEIFRVGTELHGKPARITKDMLEARGIGIVNIPYVYGIQAVSDNARIDLVVELVPENEKNTVDRLGNMNLKETFWETDIPKMEIPTGQGRSVATLIAAATNVFVGKKMGTDQLSIIAERMKKSNEGKQ